MADRPCELGALDSDGLGLRDPVPLAALGVDVDTLEPGRRPLTRSCLDWSERRPHLAGALGAAVLDALLDQRWLTRRPGSRALVVTPAGQDGFHAALGLEVA